MLKLGRNERDPVLRLLRCLLRRHLSMKTASAFRNDERTAQLRGIRHCEARSDEAIFLLIHIYGIAPRLQFGFTTVYGFIAPHKHIIRISVQATVVNFNALLF